MLITLKANLLESSAQWCRMQIKLGASDASGQRISIVKLSFPPTQLSLTYLTRDAF